MILILLYSMLVNVFTLVTSTGGNMIGPGRWLVLSTSRCELDEQFPVRLELVRRKINRTHDGFSARLDVPEQLDDSAAVRVDICKHVDGGCKPYQVLTDESLPHFVEKFAQDNAERAFVLAGLDPPAFPVPPGEYEIKDYVFDYTELPDEAIYGEFGARAVLLRGDEELACLQLELQFAQED